MKRAITILLLLFQVCHFAQGQTVTYTDSTIERTGYLLIGDHEAVWVPRALDTKNIENSFFTCQQDTGGLNISGLTYLYAYKELGASFKVSFPSMNSTTKEMVYTIPVNITVIPIKVKLKYHKSRLSTDLTGVFFEKGNCLQSALYREMDSFTVWGIELIRVEDKKKFSRLKKRIDKNIEKYGLKG
jgi:hypothetical protein